MQREFYSFSDTSSEEEWVGPSEEEKDLCRLRQLLENREPDLSQITTLLAINPRPGMVNGLLSGNTNLSYAIKEYQTSAFGNRKELLWDIVKVLAAHPGCDPSKKGHSKDSQSPLMLAVHKGDLELLKMLSSLSAVIPKHLAEPFVEACRRGLSEMAEYLLSKGGRSDTLSLTDAIKSGSLEALRSVCGKEKAKIFKRDPNEMAPLLVAAKVSHAMTLYVLGLEGCEQNPVGPYGTNLLIESVLGGVGENVRLFLEKGYDVKMTWQGDTLLHLAAGAGHSHLFPILFEAGADVNARNHIGRTALFKVKPGDEKTLRALLSHPLCNANLVDNEHFLPLVNQIPHRIDDSEILRCAKLLMENTTAECLSRQHSHSSEHVMAKALQCGQGGRAFIKLLLEAGCTPSIQRMPTLKLSSELQIEMKDKTVFEYLADADRPEDADLIALFIEKGVRELEPVATCRYEVWKAIQNNSSTIESLLTLHRSTLLEAPPPESVALRLIDNMMFQVLKEYTGCPSDFALIITMLLRIGANPNAHYKHLDTPIAALLKRTGNHRLSIVKALLAGGATVHSDELRYIQLAIDNSHFDVALHLVSAVGIDASTGGSTGVVGRIAKNIQWRVRNSGYSNNQDYITESLRLADAIIAHSDKNVEWQLIKSEEYDSPSINRLLLQHGTSVNNAPVDMHLRDETFLNDDEDFTSDDGSYDCLQVRKPMIDLPSPLASFCQGYSSDSTKFFCRQRLRIIRALLDNGMDVNGDVGTNTQEAATPLMIAAKYLWFDLVWVLMENGADVTRKYKGETAFDMLHLETSTSRVKVRRQIAKLLDPTIKVPDSTPRKGQPPFDECEEKRESYDLDQDSMTESDEEWWSDQQDWEYDDYYEDVDAYGNHDYYKEIYGSEGSNGDYVEDDDDE